MIVSTRTISLSTRLVVSRVLNGVITEVGGGQVVYSNDVFAVGNDGYFTANGALYRLNFVPAFGMNPAHILYECITNGEWGMGYPASMIDTASFEAAADTFHSEGMGLCIEWSQQDAIINFIQLVVDHAGAALGEDPRTGLFRLKAIRADYTLGSLPEYSAAAGNIISLDDFERASITETINEVSVSYVDAETGEEGSVTVQQLANIQAQGAVVSQSRNYPGLPTPSLALRVAMRDLKAAASTLARVKLTVTRSAYLLQPGDVIRFVWPELGISAMAPRRPSSPTPRD